MVQWWTLAYMESFCYTSWAQVLTSCHWLLQECLEYGYSTGYFIDAAAYWQNLQAVIIE